MPKPVIRTQTRYQPDLHQWLATRAKQNNRSLNGELMEVLKQLKEAEQKTVKLVSQA
jgi:predicted HicB family RNase H-like nuclease